FVVTLTLLPAWLATLGDLVAQCAPMHPASFLQNTAPCSPSNPGPSWEASGAVFHRIRQQLLIVGDEGDLIAMDPQSGAILQSWCLPGDPDLEGICVADPCSPFVFLLDESASTISEFDLDRRLIRRRFSLRRGAFEAIEFVPDRSGSAQGGVFYVGEQTTGTIEVYELPLQVPGSSTAIHLRTITAVPPSHIPDYDFRGFDYDGDADVLYAISRTNNLIVA